MPQIVLAQHRSAALFLAGAALCLSGCRARDHSQPTVVAEFEGDLDPSARVLQLRAVRVQPASPSAALIEIPVSQDGIAGAGAPDSVELVTETNAWGAACGKEGTACADVTVRSFYQSYELHDVYVEIVELTPPTGGLGIASSAPPASGEVEATYGLWRYPALLDAGASAPGANAATRRWTFDVLSAQPHHFRGRVMARLVQARPDATGLLATCGDAAVPLDTTADCGECGRGAPEGAGCAYAVQGGLRSGTSALRLAVSCPTAGQTACDTARPDALVCRDLEADPRNCGVCGNDCGAGACVAGACTQVTCAAGELACGDVCCPAGATCAAGRCLLTDAAEIAVGWDHACATTATTARLPTLTWIDNGAGTPAIPNNVVCWGQNHLTQWGAPLWPRAVAAPETFEGEPGYHLWDDMGDLASGGQWSVAQSATRDPAARRWGEGFPPVDGWHTRATRFAVGGRHGCAPFPFPGTTTPEGLYCWGRNAHGALGIGTPMGSDVTCQTDGEGGRCFVPTVDGYPYVAPYNGGMTALAVAAGGDSTCAILAGAPAECRVYGEPDGSGGTWGWGGCRGRGQVAGTVACWGDDSGGQVTGVPGPDVPLPQLVPGVSDAVQLSVGGAHAVALLQDGRLAFWGTDDQGQFGDLATATTAGSVTLVDPGRAVSQVAAGAGFTCYLAGGEVYCAGRNDLGQLGRGTLGGASATFARVLNVAGATALSVGGMSGDGLGAPLGSACALVGGAVLCWGDDSQGQLGRGTSGAASGDALPVELEPTRRR